MRASHASVTIHVGMIEILVVLALGGLVLFLTARLVRKRRTKAPARRERVALDGWVEEQVAQATAKKLILEPDVLFKTLRGDPDPDTVTSLEQEVRSVQLCYERLAQAREAEVRIELSYEDGTSSTIRKRVHWDELPQMVRDEFDRTGAAHVYRPWHFPWSDPGA